jgi:hypothetical protein
MESGFAIEFARPDAAGTVPGAAAAAGPPQTTFHEVLGLINPLQYEPVVGNIFRALTGDGPPEPVRLVGSFIFSALTGGPLGMALNVAVTAVEKLTGLDPDHIAHEVLASVGIINDAPPAPGSPAPTGANTAYAAAAYTRTMQIDHTAGERA